LKPTHPRNKHMTADRPEQKSPELDVTAALRDVGGDFINSATNREDLHLFLSLAMVAWNVSVRGPSEAEEMIALFIERFECPTHRIRKADLDTRDKVLELAARKSRFYPDMRFVIREVKCQDRSDGLYLEVTQIEAV